jgi:glycosyltransferase involved in cell wall biosynthesis
VSEYLDATVIAADSVEDVAVTSLIDQITVLILTYNEEANIGRTLSALARFTEIVVLDSNSTDETSAIVASFANARLVQRPFDTHANQWNYGLHSCGIKRAWILALDADYLLSDKCVDEIAALAPSEEVSGYQASFNYCLHGRRLRASLYPSHVVLFRRDRGRYEQHGHTQRPVIGGKIGMLSVPFDHDDRKPHSRWLSSQQKYARLEADFLLSYAKGKLRLVDRLRLTGVFGPILVFLYTLLAKRCILDGWPGWLYVLQRTLAETMIALEIVDRRMRKQSE